ncbi:MAG: amino acid adenylation domain-containing protein, partial [bacterium]|nr:amino acid adenylation domain-containing protein [bacterium]
MSILTYLLGVEKLDISIRLMDGKLKINAPEGRLTPALLNELKDKKEEIIHFLQQNAKIQTQFTVLEPSEEKEYYTASSPQKRLYFLQQRLPGNVSYNMMSVMPLPKNLDVQRLEDTFKQLIARHESLRTSFDIIGDELVQKIHPEVALDMEYDDLSRHPEVNVNDRIKHFRRPFDLSRAPLLRLGLLKTVEQTYIMMMDMHHIIVDGISQVLLTEDFMVLFRGGKPKPLAFRYRDYSQWQNRQMNSQRIKQQETYWLELFSDVPGIVQLPADHPRSVMQMADGRSARFALNKTDTKRLKEISSEKDVTLYMILLALFNILISKLSGREDIVVGTPVSGRHHAEVERIIGMFLSTLPMRNYPAGEKPFSAFLAEIKYNTLKAFDNQEYPFENLIDEINIERDDTRNPLFDVFFNLLNQVESQGGTPVGNDNEDRGDHTEISAKFDLNLAAIERGNRLEFSLVYRTGLFEYDTIERIITYFKHIISSVLLNPHRKISDIRLTSEDVAKKKLNDFNANLKETPDVVPLQVTLADSFQKHQSNTAIEYGPVQMTYGELERRAAVVCRRITSGNIPQGSFIGIYLEDKIDIISVIIGTLKAGCVFVPLDSRLPVNRLARMLQTVDIQIVFTDEDNEKTLSQIREDHSVAATVFVIDSSWGQDSPHPFEQRDEPGISYHPEANAYVYFTSGSTGIPSAILGKNEGLAQFIRWEIETFSVSGSDRVSQLTAVGFDAFLRDIFTPLFSGGTICLPPSRDLVLNSRGLLDWIGKSRITLIHCIPGVFRLINLETTRADRFACLKYIILSGEPVSPQELKGWYDIFGDRIQVVNFYGPTETTLIKTFYLIKPGDVERNRIPAGVPMRGTRTIILDENMKLCDHGIQGEIYIRTPYRTHGYLNAPELTARRFLKNPFRPDEDDRDIIYKTGDLGREFENGELEILGRVDRQVKIRGVRVELDSIESRLLKHKLIGQAVVISRTDEGGGIYLCAYLVKKQAVEVTENLLSPTKLREYLAAELPEHMIPAYFMVIETLPLTLNGKLDIKALPDPQFIDTNDYVAPGNETERKLVEIWTKVLFVEAEEIGIDTDFFELGGQSLKAILLISRMHKALNVLVPLPEVFQGPTVRQLAQYIRTAARERYAAIESIEKRKFYALSSAQKRLYILNRMNLENIAYNMPQFIPFEKTPPLEKLEEAFTKLINRHESLRTSFHVIDSQPVQQVHDEVEFSIELREESGGTNMLQSFVRSFDLSGAPLLRVGLLKTGESRTILMVDMHHIISDWISMEVLRTDFIALLNGETLPLLRIQYKDFSHWQNSQSQHKDAASQKAFWLKQFEGEIPVLQLPVDYPRPTIQSFEGHSLRSGLSVEDTLGLRALAQDTGSTLFMVLLSLTAILMSKLSGQEDLVIGTPVAGRRHADLEKIIGMFVNTLSLRNYPAAEKTAEGFLKEVKERTLSAFENQEYQFDELVEQLPLERDTGRNPLFDILFSLHNLNTAAASGNTAAADDVKEPQPESRGDTYQGVVAKFDLTISVTESTDNLLLGFQYCTKLFNSGTIRRFMGYFKQLASAVVKAPGMKLSDIRIISPEEKEQLLFDLNDTDRDYPKDKTICRLFEEQAERTPDHIAVTSVASITYRELNQRARQLACTLKGRGVAHSNIVGLMPERSLSMIIGLLSILKAGGAYLPVDPGSPMERVAYMLADANATMILISGLPDRPDLSVPCIHIDDEALQDRRDNDNHDLLPGSTHRDPIYVSYTSGSTGKPKGVMIENQSVVNFIKGMTDEISFTPSDTLFSLTTISFDIFGLETLLPLTLGTKVVIGTVEEQTDPFAAASVMQKEKVSLFQLTPSRLQMMIANHETSSSLKRLAYLMVGGEAFPLPLLGMVRRITQAKIVNLYGPTETTIWSTLKDLTGNVSLTIGRPIANTQIYILSRWRSLQPVGVVGDLFIAGDGLARGYVNKPELTADRFVDYKLQMTGKTTADQVVKVYKTGDL